MRTVQNMIVRASLSLDIPLIPELVITYICFYVFQMVAKQFDPIEIYLK